MHALTLGAAFTPEYVAETTMPLPERSRMSQFVMLGVRLWLEPVASTETPSVAYFTRHHFKREVPDPRRWTPAQSPAAGTPSLPVTAPPSALSSREVNTIGSACVPTAWRSPSTVTEAFGATRTTAPGSMVREPAEVTWNVLVTTNGLPTAFHVHSAPVLPLTDVGPAPSGTPSTPFEYGL